MPNFLTPTELNKLLTFKLMGQSGGYRPMMPEMDSSRMTYTPDMLNARLGLQGDNLSGAVSGTLIRLPDGSYSRQPGLLEMGYRTPFLGGTVGVNAGVGPRNMYNARLSYEREF